MYPLNRVNSKMLDQIAGSFVWLYEPCIRERLWWSEEEGDTFRREAFKRLHKRYSVGGRASKDNWLKFSSAVRGWCRGGFIGEQGKTAEDLVRLLERIREIMRIQPELTRLLSRDTIKDSTKFLKACETWRIRIVEKPDAKVKKPTGKHYDTRKVKLRSSE